jgi:hypothetical protein
MDWFLTRCQMVKLWLRGSKANLSEALAAALEGSQLAPAKHAI